MGKFIKEKAKKSLPIFIIICLINLFFAGLSFNLNFDFNNIHKDGFVNIGMEVMADQASTTVTVQNAPPWFTVAPAETPESTSTSPVNVGASIGFTATAQDGQEGDDYWLIICTTTAATSTPVTMLPTCVGGNYLCRSSLASSSVQASCTYPSVKNVVPETQAWYAFVCDDHAGDARCSLTGATNWQGSGNSGSPFYINHPPVLVNAYTSVNNQPPGGTFTIFAESTDPDSAGGIDDLEMYACTTNSWTLGGGCASTTLCTGTSSAPDVSCQYTDTAPTADQAYTYYVFLKDWHELPATSGQGDSSTYTITNVAPTVASVSLNGGSNIGLNIKGAPRVSILTTSLSVTDNNGCVDLSSATSTIYLGSVAGGASCTANDNNCYQITSSYCFLSDCTGAADVDAIATFVCSTTLVFYTVPTDSQAGASTTSWFSSITARDNNNAVGSGSYTTLDGVEVVSTAALMVNESSIDYGVIQAGSDTGNRNSTTTVVNYGNTPIDCTVEGTDMARLPSGSEIIGIEYQQHCINNFAYGDVGCNYTSSSTPDLVNVVVGRPTSATDVTDHVYWGIGLPLGVPSADYAGENTFTVVEDLDGNWN